MSGVPAVISGRKASNTVVEPAETTNIICVVDLVETTNIHGYYLTI